MKSPLSRKERNKTVILRFIIIFLKIWKMGEIYKVERIEERVEPCSIPTSMLKKREIKLFYKY